ncbi:hypothetical protein ABZV67_04450 [Streptomyces sp. NPDC005065]|uniref:hypothetical protein n=1 Tax=unclassified Streptomyces TaxID=2593676 RepID=UPI0033A42CCC
MVGRSVPGNRHDSRGWEESDAEAAVGKAMTIADGGYQGTGLVIPHAVARARDSRTGRRNTTGRTSRSEPASSTPSRA